PTWGKVESVSWKSDQYDVQGWLVFPLHYEPAKKYPLVVEVHGGPASVLTSAWPKHFYQPLLLSGKGYFVFFPNPRGSYGQGEEFTQANVKDFGYGDLNDILRGVDTVISEYPIDPGRLGITGWSYGGYMTMWAITQTNRFAAAVAGAGIVNWQSYYGQNRIDTWMLPYFGASVYDDPYIYERSSPIPFIRGVTTPTLVLHGDREAEAGRCPREAPAPRPRASRGVGRDRARSRRARRAEHDALAAPRVPRVLREYGRGAGRRRRHPRGRLQPDRHPLANVADPDG